MNDQAGNDWDSLLEATAAFQGLVPDAVLVGGTAAAVHVHHRLSTDADLTLTDLRTRFEELMRRLDTHPDWELDRRKAPVMIMGSFQGVETTLRQLIRAKPLETEKVGTRGGDITVPTVAEMIRVKGWLVLSRNAFRDYLDFAALTHHAGDQKTVDALARFDEFYVDVPHKRVLKDVSPLLQLARQLADPLPSDLPDKEEVARYKGIVALWDTWEKVADQCGHACILATTASLGVTSALSSEQEHPPVYPEHPKGTHKAFMLSDGKTVVIRELDEGTGEYYRIGNPSGPAIVSGKAELYALHGQKMSREEWLNHPDVQRHASSGPKQV